jgi:hypothetical protein
MNKSLNGFPLAPSLFTSDASAPTLDPTLVGTRGSAIAGVNIRKNDGLVIAADGRVYPFEFVDCDARLSTSTPNVSSGPAFNHHRQQQLRHPENGDVYYVSNYYFGGAGVGGLVLNRCSSWGNANAIYRPVDTAGIARASDRMFWLSNGNICVVWQLNGGDLKFAIYDRALNQVVAPTAIATPASDGFFDAHPLAGGGFAACWLGAAGAQKLAIFDNAGGVVTPAATIQNWAGAVDTSLGVKMAELSNGNLAIAFASRFGGSKGLYAGVWSPVGAQVVAPALLYAPAAQPVAFPEIAVLPGFFAVAQADTVNTKVFVLSNAGAVQGAAYSNAVGTGAAELTIKLVAGDGEFWLACQPGAGQIMFVALPTSGAGYADYKVTHSYLNAVLPIDGFWEKGYFVCSQWRYGAVFDTENRRLAGYTSFDTSTAAASPSVKQGVGFRAHSVHDEPSQALLRMSYWMQFGIVGVASADAAKGEQARFTMGPGLFTINRVPSSESYFTLDFNFLTYGGGVKGTLTPNSLFIRSVA